MLFLFFGAFLRPLKEDHMNHINLSKFKENLSKQQSPTNYSAGMFKVVGIAMHENESGEVDWNSFTLDDAEQALNHALGYTSDELIDGSIARPNEGNLIHSYLHNMESMYLLKRMRPLSQGHKDIGFF